jgi:hypothetical protein
VDLTTVHDPIEFEPRTPLGQVLWEVRRRLIASDEKMLTDEDLEREIAERRGGIRDDSE